MLYATYFGGNLTEDHVDGGTSRFDKRGVVYQAVCASCPDFIGGNNQDFPVTPNAPFTTNLSPRCSNAAFKIDFQITFLVDAKFDATPKIGCAPLTVNFTNKSKSGRGYRWDFGDSSKIDTTRNPVHTYTKPGKYLVKLTSIDSFSCNVSEMDSTIIEVLESPDAHFSYKLDICNNEINFYNESKNSSQVIWDFGDNSGIVLMQNPKHRYNQKGNYTITLIAKHPNTVCLDTFKLNLVLNSDSLQGIVVPNVFTPNNDGLNDCFMVDGVSKDCIKAHYFIYDRWGILVHQGNLPDECWNGKSFNIGEEMPEGVYYYLLSIESLENKFEKIQTNGVIHLLR